MARVHWCSGQTLSMTSCTEELWSQIVSNKLVNCPYIDLPVPPGEPLRQMVPFYLRRSLKGISIMTIEKLERRNICIIIVTGDEKEKVPVVRLADGPARYEEPLFYYILQKGRTSVLYFIFDSGHRHPGDSEHRAGDNWRVGSGLGCQAHLLGGEQPRPDWSRKLWRFTACNTSCWGNGKPTCYCSRPTQRVSDLDVTLWSVLNCLYIWFLSPLTFWNKMVLGTLNDGFRGRAYVFLWYLRMWSVKL